VPHSFPLHGLTTSRYREESAVCLPSGRRGISPLISCQITLPRIPRIATVSRERVAPVLTRGKPLLTAQAFKTLGSGYSMEGAIQVSVTHAIPSLPTPTLVLALSGTWTYAPSNRQQQHIKDLVKGKTYREALLILLSLPGVERASLTWDEKTRLPEDPKDIRLLLISGI
jgi:VCBS repeat-containing protein